MGLVFLTGGARSGKSRLAIELASRRRGPVVVLATAEALDEEMKERIRKHREQRPPGWATVEEPVELERAIRAAPVESYLVIDCLSLWVANLMGRELPPDQILARSRAAASLAAVRGTGTVAVSNNCNVPVDLRGTKPRPDACSHSRPLTTRGQRTTDGQRPDGSPGGRASA